MFFSINAFISTKDGIAEKLLLFKNKLFNLLIILIWQTYQCILLLKAILLIYAANYTVQHLSHTRLHKASLFLRKHNIIWGECNLGRVTWWVKVLQLELKGSQFKPH